MARTPAQLLLSGAVDAALDSAEGAVRLLAISELAPSETLGAEARPFAQRDGFDGAAAALCLARLAAAAGDFEDASFRADDAAARFRQSDEPIFEALAHLEVAAWLLGRNGPADGSAAASRIADAARIGLAHDEGALLEPRLELCRAWSRGVSGDLQGAIASLEQQAAGAPHELARARAWSVIARLQADAGANAANERAKQQAIMAYDGALLALPTEHRVHFWREPGRVHLKAKGQAHAPHDKRALRLLDITKRLASEHDQERLLERITDAAVELAGAERAFVLLPDHEGTLVPHLIRSSVAEDDPSVAFSRSIAEAVWIDGEPLLTVDAQGDGRLSEYLSVHKLMLRSVACLPIRGRTGTVGVLYLEHRLRSGRFKLDDLEILMAFADLAAIAIGNARLISRLEEEERRTREAKAEVEAAKGEVERVLALRTDELLSARDELRAARASLRGRYEREGIVGRSDAMRRVFAMMDRVRGSSVPVVIRGESGTGKELVARAIHFTGARADGPFVALNCGAIPEALLESELFGHVRGAFTGADRDRAGVLERASGGTLFLDEVGDMPAKMQVDLLRVLQDGVVRPVGGGIEQEVRVDVRIISASNKSLPKLVEDGAFREDLFYRLQVVGIVLPPLRERRADVPLLVDHLLRRIAKREDAAPKRLTRAALERLATARLPGNVRQLEHVLLNAFVLVDGDTIDADDLALNESDVATQMPAIPSQSLGDFKSDEKQRILAALEANGWNRAKAARALSIPRRTFYRRLKEHGILQ